MSWQLLLILLIPLAIFVGTYVVKPVAFGRGIRSVLLMCAAAFCVFGFLASFEPPGSGLAKTVYGVLGVSAVAGARATLDSPASEMRGVMSAGNAWGQSVDQALLLA